MKMIVGLGNPGLQYAATRHNCGFLTIDKLAYDLQAATAKKEQNALTQQVFYQGQKLLLVKPQSYMNLSGFPVTALLHYYKIATKDMLVIFDDMDLPAATVRLRHQGSAGGHNGIKSMIEQLGSKEFARIKIGISHGFVGSDHVLGRFSAAEMPLMAEAFALAAEAALCWANLGITAAMNRYNRKTEDDKQKPAEG